MQPEQRLFTLGFIFDATLEQVLLIHKQRPTWQAGKFNGVGGKLEAGETPVQGVLREVWEESDLHIPADRWTLTAEMASDDWCVYVFTAVYNGALSDVHAKTDEPLEWLPVNTLPDTVISNLTWLIPLCLDRLRNGTPELCVASY